MTQSRFTSVVAWTCVALAAVAVAVAGRLAVGQQPSPASKPSTLAAAAPAEPTPESPAETPVPEDAATKKKEFRGRLPAYYSRVVDEKQREKIYAIQGEYAPKIDALKAQLEALTAERDKKITAVLTPEQLDTVEKLRAEAKAKRARGSAAKSSPE